MTRAKTQRVEPDSAAAAALIADTDAVVVAAAEAVDGT